MSPEQAKGRTADKRSDIWAFGVVLYEMLTGRQLFGGETVTEVIAAVIKDTPSLDALPPSTPAPLRRLMERCLERDPRSRLRDIGEARIALARTNQTADGASAPRRRSLANGRREPVTGGQDVNSVRLGSPGRLLFLRVGANDGLWATALTRNTIDLSKGSLLEPGAVEFDAASDSLIAIFPAKDRRELVWLSRGGVTTDIAGAPFDTSTGDIALSPDGRRAVLAMRGPNLTGYFVVRDLETGADTRVPQPQAPSIMANGSGTVSWTPTQRLMYATGGIESWHLYDWPSDGSTGSRALADGLAAKMTRDGSRLFYLHDERGTYRLLQTAIGQDGSPATPKPVFPDADMKVRGFDVSPDGRLLAFTTQNSDTQFLNVIVTTLPDMRERRQVTTFGQNRPVFSRDGRELYFLSEERASGTGRGQLNVVAVAAAPFTVGVPTSLFAVGGTGGPSMSGFDVAADGRVMMTRSAPLAEGGEQRAVLRHASDQLIFLPCERCFSRSPCRCRTGARCPVSASA